MKRLWFILLASLTLVGCGAKLVYDNLDWFAKQYIEEFVDLNRTQQNLLSDSIQSATPWHKQSEIPQYIIHLDELMSIEPREFTQEQLVTQQNKFRQHSLRLFRHFTPSIVEFVSNMSDAQVEQLMNEIRVRHIKFKRKYAQKSETELREVYRQRLEEGLNEWLGDLTPSQLQSIEQWAQQWMVTTLLWSQFQTQIRVELTKMFATRGDKGALQDALEALVYQPEQFYSDELAQRIEFNTDLAQRYTLEIIQQMNPKQTQLLREELQDWREIALELAE